jgi:catechol 2,3-dioxygenase
MGPEDPISTGMDAPPPSPAPGLALGAPIHVRALGLRVRDLDRVLGFYREVLGLDVLEGTRRQAWLGAGGVALLELTHDPDALPDDTREAGLYHTAFLMPSRRDLAQWLLETARRRVPITGASDHGVSEAIYLDDPEGNRVEVYADRAPERWRWEGDQVLMPTDRLDRNGLLAEADPAAAYCAPEGLRIGHVHLRVGDLGDAERFYRDGLGLAVTRRRGGATFLSSGGYHHHVAGNVWQSAGAGPRDGRRAGLSWFSLEVHAAAHADVIERLRTAGVALSPAGEMLELADPWGTRLHLSESPA